MYTKQKDKSVERMKWWKNGIVRRFKVVIKEIRMKNAKTCYFNWIVCEEWHMVWQQIWQRDKKVTREKTTIVATSKMSQLIILRVPGSELTAA